MGALTSWWKSFASAGDRKRVATLAWLETPEAEPAESGSLVLVHGQRMVLVDPAGIALLRFAANTLGATSGLAPGATATLASVVAGASMRLRGFRVTGTGDARVILALDGVERHFGVLSIIERTPTLRLDPPELVTAGVTVALKVKNEGSSAADYQGVLLAD